MIEYGGNPEETIMRIRHARHGALNLQQTNFVFMFGSKNSANSCCTIC